MFQHYGISLGDRCDKVARCFGEYRIITHSFKTVDCFLKKNKSVREGGRSVKKANDNQIVNFLCFKFKFVSFIHKGWRRDF